MIGQTISHYRIVEKLGEGGMGVVYKTEDLKLGRAVALKFLPSHLLESAEHKARFLHEARAAALLDHPNICTVFEIDEVDGRAFLAMAFLAGRTLKQKIATRPLPLAEALDIAIQIGQGLQAAHEKGIVHRDIKPANVMITPQRQVKIMDFGLAQLSDRTKLTATGIKLGTPAYMSPEQTEGKPADRRSDIWSLGVVLYEMVSGQAPFCSEVEAGLARAILDDNPEPLTAVRAGLPMELDRMVAKTLAKSPDERYQHIEDLLVDLRALSKANLAIRPSGPQPRPGIPVPTSSPRRRALWPALTIAALLAGIAAGLWFRPSQPERIVRFNLAVPGVSIGALPQPAPDGSAVIYPGVDAEGRHMLWLRPLDSEQATPLAGTEGAIDPFWSPDGRWIAFYAGGKLKKVSRDGAGVQTITSLPGFFGGAWTPAGEILLTLGNRTPLYRVSDSGGTPQPLTSLDESRAENSHRWVTVLPDGRRFLFFARCGARENNALYEGSLDSGTTRRVSRLESNVAFVPPGRGKSAMLLFAKDGKLFQQAFDGSSPQGEPAVVMDVQYSAISALGDFALSADGSLLVTRQPFEGDMRLTWLDRKGTVLGTLGTPGVYSEPRISPDGTRVIFNRPDDSGGNRDIWTLETGRGIAARLTLNPANEWANVWSPDGKAVLFASDRGGNRFGSMFQKASMDPGAGESAIESLPDSAVPMDWSSDGRWIAFIHGGVHGTISVMPTFGERKPFAFLDTPFQERLPRFSPDSGWIAYQSDESGRFEIYARPFRGAAAAETGKIQISEHGGYFAAWSAQSKELYFLGPDSKLYAADVSALEKGVVGSPVALFEACPGNVPTGAATQGRSYEVAPSGEKFLFLCGSEAAGRYSAFANWRPR